MNEYNHKDIESVWQEKWKSVPKRVISPHAQNSYILVEFPYPSGNLHVGHWYAFAVTDMLARFRLLQGKNVLFPIGFDSFGLPAENAAIKRGLNPKEWTYSNISYMENQLRSMGTIFNWDAKVVTSDPEYYKWTQWIFIQFLEKGIVRHEKTHVNWCPSCKTVLANEQLENGSCERCGSDVEQKKMMQWNIAITEYADRLIDDLATLDWPDHIKESQKNWIGRSEGSFFTFKLKGVADNLSDREIKVFTTRPDTLFGVTYIVLAPEHELVSELLNAQCIKNRNDVISYQELTNRQTHLERQSSKEKTGIKLEGVECLHPATGEPVVIYIANYVLAEYGTGAVMAVPAHDERDFEFAHAHKLPIKQSIQPTYTDKKNIKENTHHNVFTEKGELINSTNEFNGLLSDEAMVAITKKYGETATTYKLRDWSVSRQRYWGCPIPIIHCAKCGTVPVPEDQLPVTLPEMEEITMRDDGKSPLAHNDEWVNVECPQCAEMAKRETDTLDTFVDSSWYYIRYTDSQNKEELASHKKISEWLPVDFYSGGSEHTTRHLLYARFVYKVMSDLNIVPGNEPFLKRNNRGLILGPDGNKMSKSKGNVIDPDNIVDSVGSDSLRLYLAFMGPYGEAGSYPWDPNGVVGMRRFLERVWKLKSYVVSEDYPEAVTMLHKTINQVTSDIERLKFNTAIAAMMTLLNYLEKNTCPQHVYESLLVMLSIFTPHITEELWMRSGKQNSIFMEDWPKYDKTLVISDTMTLAIQINGKVRHSITVPQTIKEDELQSTVLSTPEIKKWIKDDSVKRFIYIPAKIINIVI